MRVSWEPSLFEQHFCSLCSYSSAESSSGCSSCCQIRIQEDRWQLQEPWWKVSRQTLWHQENGGSLCSCWQHPRDSAPLPLAPRCPCGTGKEEMSVCAGGGGSSLH